MDEHFFYENAFMMHHGLLKNEIDFNFGWAKKVVVRYRPVLPWSLHPGKLEELLLVCQTALFCARLLRCKSH